MSRNNNFNFLRLLLALLVLLSHSPELIDGDRHREILTNIFHRISFGELAVDGFFLLSGYLIVQSWQRRPKLDIFLRKRFLRIYPGFIVATLICVFLVIPLAVVPINFFTPVNFIIHLKEIILLSPPSSPPIFQGKPYPLLNGAMWTIAYEFRCYLLVAILGTIGALKKTTIWLSLSIIILLIYTFPGFTSIVHFPKPSYWFGNFSDFIRFLTFFCIGGCFYIFHAQIRYSRIRMVLALLILMISLSINNALNFSLPTVGAYLFFGFAFSNVPLLKRFQTIPDASYGIYLYGWPVQKLLIWYFPLISPWLLFLLSAGVSLGCGLLSWYLIEKPCLQLRD
jgi:peptidoglycan/LPS O-acetylase OafA/YrhL